ncbi:uncharacterized protein K02A2.6-like [Cydia amplana]|uniref:uncharacterized protein K02A2.6-like n=1 Tax=Cydia amplana TaxID=1869771 RepID=UPI002FE65F0C
MTARVDRFQFDSFDNKTEDWDYYIQRFEIELQIHGLDKETSEDKRKQLLLSRIGPTAFKVLVDYYRPVVVTTKSYDDLKKVLNEYYGKKTYVLSERVTFATRHRKAEETITQFILELRSLAGYCEFGTTLDERIRDQLVIGINNSTWQQELIKEHPTNSAKLSDVIATANKLEQAELQSQRLTNNPQMGTEQQTVNKIRPKTHRPTQQQTPKVKTCMFCGRDFHTNMNDCPAKGKRCNACGKENHFSSVCITSGRLKLKQNNTTRQITRQTDSDDDNFDEQSIHTFAVKRHNNPTTKIMIPTQLNAKRVEMLYDPGAVHSVIGKNLWNSIGRPPLKKCKNLMAYTEVEIETLGTCEITVNAFNIQKVLTVYVTLRNDIPLFGLDWCLSFKLPLPPGARLCNIKTPAAITSTQHDTKHNNAVQNILQDFKSLFDGKLGTIKGHSAKIHIPNDVTPKTFRPRPVPLALREQVNSELQRLVQEEVIEPVDTMSTPIEWASPIVIAIKANGSIRICADFKVTINQHVQTDDYPLPRFEEITSKLSGGQLFTKIDLKDAYLQLMIHPESRKYLTISTHKGYFRYKRLPFGISFAPAVFQRTMHQILSGIDGVVCYLDDILITAHNLEEHLTRVKTVLKRLQDAGVKSQVNKCAWLQESVTFLGHKIDASGLHPTEERINAIKNMPIPANTTELRALLGSLTYYGRFIDSLHMRCAPLYRHLKKNQRWNWTEEDTRITNELKNILTSSDTLVHYDENKPIYLSSDASEKGLGAVLFHKINETMRPVAYASRTLSDVEQRYSTIDREALGIVYAVTKFHQYLYGRKFILLTDHKPLERIFSQDRETPKIASNRLLRWAMILNSYEYSIHYQAARENTPADALSRLPIACNDTTLEERTGLPQFAHLLHLRLENIPLTKHELQKQTLKDKTLNIIKNYIITHWPDKKDLSNGLHTFYEKRDQISYEDGILLWNGRLVIPETLRPQILEMLHDGHNGITAMQSLARLHVYWPNIDKDILTFSKRCSLCQQSRSNTNEAPVFPWGIPVEPWHRLHVDYAGPFLGHMWLIVIDAYTKWLEVVPMNVTTTRATVQRLKNIFATFGTPRYIVSDNGPQFTSEDFNHFCQVSGITHIKTTPYHPKTNGLAERAVRTFKERMLASDRNLDLHERLNSFLRGYRNTPRRSTDRSPYEMMFGRPIRTTFDLWKPDVRENMEKARLKQILRPTNKVVVPPVYKPGDKVWINKPIGKGSDPGTIIKCNGPYSYEVELTNGVHKRKHADQLRLRYEQVPKTAIDINQQTSRHVPETRQPESEQVPRRTIKIKNFTYYRRNVNTREQSGDHGEQPAPVAPNRDHPDGPMPPPAPVASTSRDTGGGAAEPPAPPPSSAQPDPPSPRRSGRKTKPPSRFGFFGL